MKTVKKILSITKIIFFLISIVGLILLMPNMLKIGITGIILIIVSIIYILANGMLFLLKIKRINNNLVFNILNNFLYLYIALVAYKYISSTNTLNYVINNTYFKINYIIIVISMIGILVNAFIIIKNKNNS
jgi:hypothetical protein